MITSSSVSEQLEERGVQIVECSIPVEMTIDEWRRRRPRAARRRPWRRRVSTPKAARHLAAVPDATCEHLHDTTSRYDRREKQLTFLLVCDVCETEKVVERLPYEPRFEQLEQAPERKAA